LAAPAPWPRPRGRRSVDGGRSETSADGLDPPRSPEHYRPAGVSLAASGDRFRALFVATNDNQPNNRTDVFYGAFRSFARSGGQAAAASAPTVRAGNAGAARTTLKFPPRRPHHAAAQAGHARVLTRAAGAEQHHAGVAVLRQGRVGVQVADGELLGVRREDPADDVAVDRVAGPL
jgi:hypothetical protein